MKAEISDEWIAATVESRSDLAIAFDLAFTLSEAPTHWVGDETAVILVAHPLSGLKNFKELLAKPNPKDLARDIWKRLEPPETVPTVVSIPFRPVMGGIGGWNQLELLMYQAKLICTVAVHQVVTTHA